MIRRSEPPAHTGVPRPVLRIPALAAAIAALSILAAAPAPAAAQAWQDPARVRLIDGGVLADGPDRLAGLEILLDPGWKTYWRDPGDSGIPPQLDFSGSRNLAAVEIEWPAPELHWDGYAWIVGYTEAVVFPLVVTPQDPDVPVDLDVRLAYGVCKDICVPAEAEAERLLDGRSARPAGIEFYRARVPVAVDGPDGRGGVVSATVDRSGEVPVLELRLKLPGEPDDAYAVVEAPEGWYLPVPERSDAEPGLFLVPLDGAPDAAAIRGAELRVTGVSPTFSFEQRVALD
ncbi:protein-disulfide reductase DsbD domain-containing protein [Microbaculum marinum]|uniref:Protein-disulfide reductase DsbD domain-containing protein n=1 Tax=Microbaculum marinum TaxID=1764581 RepID=A0AAW9RNE5_9HYPH